MELEELRFLGIMVLLRGHRKRRRERDELTFRLSETLVPSSVREDEDAQRASHRRRWGRCAEMFESRKVKERVAEARACQDLARRTYR